VSASCDVNVTYDLLQGEFPPPSLGGLSVKIEEDEDLLSQDPIRDRFNKNPFRPETFRTYFSSSYAGQSPSQKQQTSIDLTIRDSDIVF
jgi:hypothetical protein